MNNIDKSLTDIVTELHNYIDILDLCSIDTRNLKRDISNIFNSAEPKHYIKIKLIDGIYFIYTTQEKPGLITRYIVGKYKTKNRQEVVMLVLSKLINDYCCQKTINKFGDGECIEYGFDSDGNAEIDKYENNLKEEILKKLPIEISKELQESDSLSKVTEYFIDTNIYKGWLES